MTSAHWIDSTYHGHAPALASALVNIAHGGQTVCNEAAWKMLQDNLPGRCQVSEGVGVCEGGGVSGVSVGGVGV